MKHALAAVLIATIIGGVSEAETVRTPIATIPGTGGTEGTPIVAAGNSALAIGYFGAPSPQVSVYSIPNWKAPVATLTISNPNAMVTDIAVQNQYIAVGAVDTTNNWYGAIYIFTKPEGGWQSESETATLTPSNPSDEDGLGAYISVWGNTLLTSGHNDAGYIFIEPPGGWVNATETAQLAPSDNPQYFGGGVAISGNVGSGGSVAVISGGSGKSTVAYVFVAPSGNWTSMTQTAELTGAAGPPGPVSIAKSTIAVSTTPVEHTLPVGALKIFLEPEGGWVDSSSPNYSAAPKSTLVNFAQRDVTLRQDAEVLVGGSGSSQSKPLIADLVYLWHADNDFDYAITLSTKGMSDSLLGSTVNKDYAFTWDEQGNVYVFKGN
jgi:hypothetical protein